MASFEERLAQMRTPAGGAAPAVTEQDNSVQDRLAQMRGTQGGAATPSPTPAVSEDKDEDKGNFWDRVKGMFGNIFTKEDETEQPTTLQTTNKAESKDDEDVSKYVEDLSGKTTAATYDSREGVDDVDYGKLLVGVGRKGINQFAGTIASTADWLLGKPLAAAGWENNPFSWLNQEMKNEAQMLSEIYDENANQSVPAQLFNKYGPSVVATLPDALMAIYSGGASAALSGASKSGGIINTVRNAMTTLIKNPQFWTSFARTAGPSYEEAVSEGASDVEASAAAVLTALNSGIIEVGGGGIQELPNEVRNNGTPGILAWVKSTLDEGKEEVVQGIMTRAVQNLVYRGGPVVSLEDENAVFNPKTMAEDAAGGLIVGGLVSGGQLAVNSAINAGRANTQTPTAPTAPIDVPAAPAPTAQINAMPAQGEISPSDGVSAEPATYTANAENVSRVDPGAPGFETTNVDGERRAESADYYGKSTGAATPNIGPMVETQNKAITENVNLGEESIAANQPAPHEQISEALSLARAGAMLYTDSEGNVVNFDETLDDLMSKEGNWTGVESDAVQLLLKEAERRGDAEAVKRIAERMAKEGTDLGQALQSRQKWISAEPASRLAAMYQTVAKFAEKHKAIKGGKIEIPDFLAKAYLEADSEVKRDEIIGDIQEYVAQQSRSGLMEKWTALRYTNMLGNFKTQIRNLAGNTTMLLTSRVKDEVGALAEAIYGKERTKSAFVGKDWMRAAKADYANAKKQIMSYGKYTGENFKGEFAEGIEDKRKILPAGLEQYRKATNWAMETGDTIFSKAAYSRALAGFLKANGVTAEQLAAGAVDTGLMDKARAYAIKQAQEITFRDSNAFSDWASTAFRTEDTPKVVKVLGEGLMPFRRTPANVLTRAVEYSPLGLINTAVKAAKAHKGSGDITANDVIDSLAKNITGTGLVVLGYLLSDMGLLRASGDEEDEGIDALMNRQGWSLIIPGVGSYTFDWAVPASLIMFTGAALHEMTSDEGLTFSDLEGALTSLTEPFIQMSMLSGINDTLDSIKYSDNNLLQMAGQLAAGYLTQGLTNTLLGQLERSAEGVRMSTYTEADSPLPEWLQRTIGKASAKTPGWDYQQTEYLNEFGETEDSGSAAQRLIENLLSPGYWEPTKEGEPVYDFAQDAYDSLGINAFPDAYAPKSISYDGTTHVLTQEQREAYQRTQGQTAKKLMEAAERSSAYDSLGDDAKRDVISDLLSFAREQGKRDALGISGDMSEKEKAIAALSPSDMVSYFSLEAATNAMGKDGATNAEISAMQSLIDSPISKSVAEIIMDGDFKKMYDADKAGISVRQFSTISANMDTLKTPAGYTNKPNWQKYGVIAGSDLDDGKKLELISIYGGESAYNNFSEALGKGYSFDRVVDFYEAYTRKNADGTSKDAADKKAAVLAAGFTETQYLALKKIFS